MQCILLGFTMSWKGLASRLSSLICWGEFYCFVAIAYLQSCIQETIRKSVVSNLSCLNWLRVALVIAGLYLGGGQDTV